MVFQYQKLTKKQQKDTLKFIKFYQDEYICL